LKAKGMIRPGLDRNLLVANSFEELVKLLSI